MQVAVGCKQLLWNVTVFEDQLVRMKEQRKYEYGNLNNKDLPAETNFISRKIEG